MAKQQTSIIIVSYHTGAILLRAIEACLRQDGLKEVIIVDNGNPDEMLKKLNEIQKETDKVSLVTGHGNVGFAKGCNIGAKVAKGNYLLLLNPDCLLQRGSLVKAMDAFAHYPDAWLIGCQLLRPDGSLQGGSKRNLLTPNVAFSQSSGFHNLGKFFTSINIPETVAEQKDGADPVFVPAISGAFMMLPTGKYHELGGLDEDYFFHVEDLDLCYRINKSGGKVLYVPTVKATHFVSTSEVSSGFVERNKTKGFVTYFRKHRELSSPLLYWAIIIGIIVRLLFRLPFLLCLGFLDSYRQKPMKLKQQRQIGLLERPVPKNTLLKRKPTTCDPILIAGSTGQVGLSIMRRLLANGFNTYGLYHEQVVGYNHPKLQWVQGDLSSNYIGVNGEVLKREPPKTLIHTPAIWMLPDRLDMFARMGIKRIICFSSTSIEGKAETDNIYEKAVVEKFISAEKELLARGKKMGINITIFRPTMIYGFGIDRNITSIVKFIDLFGFFPVARPSAGMRQPVHTDDLAQAVLSVLTKRNAYGKIYNLCGNTRLTYYDMVGKVFSTLGRKSRVIRTFSLPFMLDIYSFLTGNKDTNGEVAKRMNRDLAFDDENARNDFGYKPRDFLSSGSSDLGL